MILPEVRQAMFEASQRYVHLDELMEAVGARIGELMQCVDDELRAPHREGRDDDLTSAMSGFNLKDLLFAPPKSKK